MAEKKLVPPPDLADLVAQTRPQVPESGQATGPRWILVDVAGQRLALVQDDKILWFRPASTALVGLDCRQDTGGTPAGLHRIGEKIGSGAAWGTEFRHRKPTGQIWPRGSLPADEGDLILSRILTLEGQEMGINRGPGVDSRERYIYIHGTNHEDRLGRPVSHGCVRLSNDAVIELFDLVKPGDPVLIT